MCVRAVAKRRNASWNRTSECRPPISEGLARQQRRLCTRNLDLMPAVVHSARQMAQVCQETFYESRWNCSSVLLAPRFMADLTGGRSTVYSWSHSQSGVVSFYISELVRQNVTINDKTVRLRPLFRGATIPNPKPLQ